MLSDSINNDDTTNKISCDVAYVQHQIVMEDVGGRMLTPEYQLSTVY